MDHTTQKSSPARSAILNKFWANGFTVEGWRLTNRFIPVTPTEIIAGLSTISPLSQRNQRRACGLTRYASAITFC
jgi:hypothetical protein